MRREDSNAAEPQGDVDGAGAIERFAAEAALLTPPRPRAERVSARDLAAYVSDPDAALTEGQLQLISEDARLQADLAQMTERFAIASIAPAVAASTGPIVERSFDGGAVQLVEARRAGQLYLKVKIDQLDAEPSALILSSEDGRTAKRSLLGRLSSGVATLILDLGRGEDAMLAKLVQDPAARGALV